VRTVSLVCALAFVAAITNLPAHAAKRAPKKTESAAVVEQGGLAWHTTGAAAGQAAEGKSGADDDRPILWFRHVGELTGPMCSASHRMRVVSYVDPRVQAAAREWFVPLSTNMERMAGAGSSVGHMPSDPPGLCPSRLAHQNCQAFFLTPNLEIFHAATGFLTADELFTEMDFAGKLFAKIRNEPSRAKQTVAAAHSERLREMGFKDDEIAQPKNELAGLLGFDGLPAVPGAEGVGFEMFGGMAKQRILTDHRYLIEHPLISAAEFERDPSPLVGISDFVFQSTAGAPATGRPTGKLNSAPR
jgi:hypothetical protein